MTHHPLSQLFLGAYVNFEFIIPFPPYFLHAGIRLLVHSKFRCRESNITLYIYHLNSTYTVQRL